jgi:hypothetical protein
MKSGPAEGPRRLDSLTTAVKTGPGMSAPERATPKEAAKSANNEKSMEKTMRQGAGARQWGEYPDSIDRKDMVPFSVPSAIAGADRWRMESSSAG